MTEHFQDTSVEPLDGGWVIGGLKISRRDGSRVFAKHWGAIERGLYERAYAGPHSSYPGINAIHLFRADRGGLRGPLTLPEAMALDPIPQRFLVSLVVPDLLVVTSQLGYPRSGPVTVMPSSFPGRNLEIGLFDCEDDMSPEAILQCHLGRMALVGGDPMVPLAQETADWAFRSMVYRAPERA